MTEPTVFTYEPFTLRLQDREPPSTLIVVRGVIKFLTDNKAQTTISEDGCTMQVSNVRTTAEPHELLDNLAGAFKNTPPILVRGNEGTLFYWRIAQGQIEERGAVILPADLQWVDGSSYEFLRKAKGD